MVEEKIVSKIKVRKIKYKSPKFFGWKDWKWSPWKKKTYGHYSGGPSMRTKAEKRNSDERKDYETNQ